MLVCWEWLSQYVELAVEVDVMASRFAMSGLNHESTAQVGQDVVLDLEVTSNRGDCLGHIGVAREAAVLLGKQLCIPDPQPASSAESAAAAIQVDNRFEAACPRYSARIIRGVKVAPSPAWLVRRLAAVGVASINNVVDVTNYVMMECGQPLHAFDLAQIRGGQVIVRPAKAGEKFVAIDHHTYELDPQVVVIADAERAVALGGVMGGEESEVTDQTTDLLIEAASFAPLSIRRTARKLKLHSPSSFRFERRPDPAGLDWASRRCCELILEVAGGQLANGCVVSGAEVPPRAPIEVRLPQIPRILGISVPAAEAIRILAALGCQVEHASPKLLSVVPPSWRGDLYREIDLIEEVARIHGYDQIPENVPVPLSVAAPRPKDLMLNRARHVLSAFGIDEAMTPSVVNETLENCGSVWTSEPALATETPLLVGSRLLRRSLLPSLLAARYTNQTQAIRNAQLYEVANVYLSQAKTKGLPQEQSTLGLVTTGDVRVVKGIVEEILAQVAGKLASIEWHVADHPFFQAGTSQRIGLAEQTLGWIGLVHKRVQSAVGLDHPCAAGELNLDLLTGLHTEVRRADPISPFPAVQRDLNFIVDEPLRWADLEQLCRAEGGSELQEVVYQETYRDPKKDGAGKKRLLLSLQFQSLSRTLTGEEVDVSVSRIIKACQQKLAAQLLG